VVAPDDESFGLGAILSAFADKGASLAVLCLTHGEASTLRGTPGNLCDIRVRELTAAAEVLGASTVRLHDYPDGHLTDTPTHELATRITDFAHQSGAEGLLVFDPAGVTGHPDHRQATAAVLAAARAIGLPVLGWTNSSPGSKSPGLRRRNCNVNLDDLRWDRPDLHCEPQQASGPPSSLRLDETIFGDGALDREKGCGRRSCGGGCIGGGVKKVLGEVGSDGGEESAGGSMVRP
jgi:LmbE family N-acetylglucosaminyl deacetylase